MKPASASPAARRTPPWGKIALLIFFVLAFGAFFALGGPRYLNLATIKAHRDTLLQFTAQHYAAAFAIGFCVYVIAVTLSLPGAAVLSLTAGFLFGRWAGTILTVLAASTGATLVFLGARYLFADFARKRLGGFYERMHAGFAAHAFNFLLFLRLVPLFPFFLVNLASTLAGIPLRTYLLATLIGIIPGSFVLVNLGETLGRIESSRDLVSGGTLLAFALLGLLALLPIVFRKKSAKISAASKDSS